MLEQAEVALHVVVQLRQMHGVDVEPSGPGLGVVLEATTSHLGHVLTGNARALPDCPEQVVRVARAQEGQVTLANRDVVGRRVGVELLVPLLDELALDARAVALPDAMRPHDVQDAVANGVSTAGIATWARSDSQPHEGPGRGVRGSAHGGGHGASEGLLAVRHVLRLVAPLAVPFQGLLVCEPEVASDPCSLRGIERLWPTEDVLHHA
mmetsp:Transcript_112085/g.280813  ORF Transcript_112085/g.280813 Transcript_112085/m.280813 type:complete len:209 (-) Transcript_112085:1489-2115(-)